MTYVTFITLVVLAQVSLSLPLRAQSSPEIDLQQHFQAAQEAERARDYAKSEQEYQTVLKLKPDLVAAHVNLGLVYYLQGKNDEAIGAFRSALKLDPDILGANLFLGMACVRANRYEEALEPLRKAISLKPDENRAYLNLALSYSELGRDEDALKVLQDATQRLPNDVEVLV